MYRVLIVDDEPLIREGLINLVDWVSFGCEVVSAAQNGEEALSYLMQYPVDIVVCDIRMPLMDGLELGERIAQLGLEAKIIYLSAYSNFDYAQAALKLSAADYVLKSDYIERVPEAVSKLVRKLDASRFHVKPKYGKKQWNALILQAIDVIETQYMENINLNRIARQLHVNSSYLGSLFKKETGESIVDAIARCRMENARALLGDQSLKVFQIAEAVGFTDPAYFTHVFTRHFGISPNAYRKTLP